MSSPDPMSGAGCAFYMLLFFVVIPVAFVFIHGCLSGHCPR